MFCVKIPISFTEVSFQFFGEPSDRIAFITDEDSSEILSNSSSWALFIVNMKKIRIPIEKIVSAKIKSMPQICAFLLSNFDGAILFCYCVVSFFWNAGYIFYWNSEGIFIGEGFYLQ